MVALMRYERGERHRSVCRNFVVTRDLIREVSVALEINDKDLRQYGC